MTFNQFQEQRYCRVLEYLFNITKSIQKAVSTSSQYSGGTPLIHYSFFLLLFLKSPFRQINICRYTFSRESQTFKAIISFWRSWESFPKEALLYLFINTGGNSTFKVQFG